MIKIKANRKNIPMNLNLGLKFPTKDIIDFSKEPGKVIERENVEYEKNKYNFDNPIISIILPYYNGNLYIEQTINCLINQTFPFFEILIIDDGSTQKEALDKLEEIKKKDFRIKVFHKENSGLASTRDFGCKKASDSSKYFLFQDDDDLIDKTYIEKLYWTLELNKDASWAYTDVVNFMEQENVWRKEFSSSVEINSNILVSNALVRKSAYNEVNGYNINEKSVNEDWIFWIKLLKAGHFPVHVAGFEFWYRIKKYGELQRSKSKEKQKITREYIDNILKKEGEISKRKIEYPKSDFDWNQIEDDIKKINKDFYLKKVTKDEKKTNLLIILPWLVLGGADKFIVDMVNGLNKNIEVSIITTLPSDNIWKKKLPDNIKGFYELPNFLDKKYWPLFIDKYIKQNNIDVVLVSNSVAAYSLIPYIKISNPKVSIIDYIHMEEWYVRNGGFSRDSENDKPFIDKTYVCNENSRKILIDHFNKEKDQVKTIYIGVDSDKFNPDTIDYDEAFNKFKDLKISKDKKIISFIARIDYQKRPMLLAKVIKEMNKQMKDVMFLVGGEGPLLSKIKSATRGLKNVKYLGVVHDPKALYKISDITINTSIKEGLALTSYESLSMGVPVISADVGGQKELINDEVGVIVKNLQREEDVKIFKYSNEEIMQYVDAIKKVLNNLDYYKKNCRNRILSGFTINHMIKNMNIAIEDAKNNTDKGKIEVATSAKSYLDLAKELYIQNSELTKEEYNYLVSSNIKNNECIKEKIGRTFWKYSFYRKIIDFKHRYFNKNNE